MKKRNQQKGFTLVELAIVLVIIGLIIGGVLVGQDLIKGAEINNVVSDLEGYNAAATTFRTKYNGLPGDLISQRAAQFGFVARDGSAGQGDGNSLMEGCAVRATALGCETAVFWIDLSAAQLIGQGFNATNSVADGDTAAPAVTTSDAMADYVPTTALRDSSFFHVYPQGGRNFFYLGNFDTGASGVVTNLGSAATPGLSPLEASSIDDKLDDGFPTTGVVRAVISSANGFTADVGTTVDPGAVVNPTATPTPLGSGVCVDQGAAPAIAQDELYNTASDDFANELSCNVRIRSSF